MDSNNNTVDSAMGKEDNHEIQRLKKHYERVIHDLKIQHKFKVMELEKKILEKDNKIMKYDFELKLIDQQKQQPEIGKKRRLDDDDLNIGNGIQHSKIIDIVKESMNILDKKLSNRIEQYESRLNGLQQESQFFKNEIESLKIKLDIVNTTVNLKREEEESFSTLDEAKESIFGQQNVFNEQDTKQIDDGAAKFFEQKNIVGFDQSYSEWYRSVLSILSRKTSNIYVVNYICI